MKEYYDILGVSSNASDEELESAYKRLKDQYSRDRFLEGEAGNNAAKNLTKLETAYAEILSDRKYRKDGNTEKEDFSDIEKLIKNGNLSAAQAKLDDVNDRTAEWHYLQSVVFYKKNWISESKKQLEIAMNMDPRNEKYADSYTKLKQKIDYNEKQFHSGNIGYGDGARYGDDGAHRNTERQMGGSGMNDCFSFCATWCCIDMLCSMCCR